MRSSRLLTTLGGYPLALACVGVVAALLLPFRSVLSPAQIMLLFVPFVAWVGRVSGPLPAATASMASLASVLMFFVQPYGSVEVASVADRVTLLLFLVVTLFVGILAGSLRTRAGIALQRQREIALLNRLSSRLVSEESVASMAAFIANEVVAVLGTARAAVYVREQGDHTALVAEAGEPGAGLVERACADEVLRTGVALGLAEAGEVSSSDPRGGSENEVVVCDLAREGAFVPLQTPDGLEGVLYAQPLKGARTFESGSQLRAVADLAAVFLLRHRLEEAAAHARALRESDRLKNTLVSSVSHELKTPLAAVTVRVTGLLAESGPLEDERVRRELTAVSEDLGRLDASIRDLVDVSRLESDSWRPKLDVYDISEVLGTVASHIPVGERTRVAFEVPADLPAIRIDFAQIARAISNLVENALAYTPASEPVQVGARVLGREFILWVEDRGPGVADEEKEQVFEKFYRGTASESSPAGTGLGLAIVREIVRSHGGRAWVEDATPIGARFVLSIPMERTQ